MSPVDVFHKTEKGFDEIAHRTHKLPQRMRTMLIMIDGVKAAAALMQRGAQLGVEGDFLTELEEGGFITRNPAVNVEPAAPEPVVHSEAEVDQFLRCQQFMNDIILDKLGSMRGYGMMLKLQKVDDIAGLRALLDEFQTSLAKRHPAHEAQDLTDQVRAMLQ